MAAENEDVDYRGPERRRANLQLDEALAEVQRLHGAATTLAQAVANTAHRSELEALREDVRKEHKTRTIISAAMTALAVILIFTFMTIKLNNLNKSVKHGHEIIYCLVGKTEAQRTGEVATTALVTCKQTTR